MNWCQRLWRRKEMEEELEKELNFHIDKLANELIARGQGSGIWGSGRRVG